LHSTEKAVFMAFILLKRLDSKVGGPMKEFLRYLPSVANDFIKPLNVADVSFIEIKDEIVSVGLRSKRYPLRIFRSLDGLMQSLDQRCFFRANRNTIIQIDKISKIVTFSAKSCSIEMSEGIEIRLSRRRMSLLMRALGWK
jgi:DNA-binding LytR/AlgR family response regulator